MPAPSLTLFSLSQDRDLAQQTAAAQEPEPGRHSVEMGTVRRLQTLTSSEKKKIIFFFFFFSSDKHTKVVIKRALLLNPKCEPLVASPPPTLPLTNQQTKFSESLPLLITCYSVL